MTREEAKTILEEVKMLDDSMYQYNPIYLEALDMAISALSENKGEWIPVSERLPVLRTYKLSDDVLITNGYEIDMGYLVERNGKIFWHYYGSDYDFGLKDEDNDAIAWMPLPEPYKERGECE